MKRVALIAPPYPLEEMPSPPLGLCYAAAAFEAAGAEVRIFDYIVRRYTPEKLRAELDEFRPHIAGANSVTMNFHQAAAILRDVKRHDPSIVTVMGGPHVTFDFRKALQQHPHIDLVVRGEGEATIGELLTAIGDDAGIGAVAGLALRKNGRIVETGPRNFIDDIDRLPMPARHLLPLSRYQALGFPISIITSRGCPNSCIFCQGRRMVGRKVRYRNPLSVVDEMEVIRDYGFSRVNIADDFFTANRKRVRRICREILRRGVRIAWSAFARVDSVDRRTLEIMREAGCDAVSFGIESGNQEMLDRVRKGITLEQARRAVADCRSAGMNVFASFMVGLPGETPRTLEDTRRFAEELGVPHGYHFLTPFPGTALVENLERYDIEVLTDDYLLYDANRAVVRTSALGPDEMERFVAAYTGRVKAEEADLRRRCEEGNCTDTEWLRYEGAQKLEIVFALLSQDIIEIHGRMPLSAPGRRVEELGRKIAGLLNRDVATVTSVIRFPTDRGYLKYRELEDCIRWYWPGGGTGGPPRRM